MQGEGTRMDFSRIVNVYVRGARVMKRVLEVSTILVRFVYLDTRKRTTGRSHIYHGKFPFAHKG